MLRAHKILVAFHFLLCTSARSLTHSRSRCELLNFVTEFLLPARQTFITSSLCIKIHFSSEAKPSGLWLREAEEICIKLMKSNREGGHRPKLPKLARKNPFDVLDAAGRFYAKRARA
jgi:hypothetical protein